MTAPITKHDDVEDGPWDELPQLKIAYEALRTQPRDAQIRMLDWLIGRLATDHDTAMKACEQAARDRIAKRSEKS